MLESISNWFARRKRHRAAVEAAVNHFENVTGKKAHSGGKVIGEIGGLYVVRLCHGITKPPACAWYRVQPDGQVSGEQLTFEDVRQFGEGYRR